MVLFVRLVEDLICVEVSLDCFGAASGLIANMQKKVVLFMVIKTSFKRRLSAKT